MIKLSKQALWAVLTTGRNGMTYGGYVQAYYDNFGTLDGGPPPALDEATFKAVLAADINEIIADQNMSENHLDGDDMVNLADDVLLAVQDGYSVVTWYGDDGEVLVAGIRPAELSVTD